MFATEKFDLVFFGKILRGEKYMALIVNNQVQAQLPALTPEVCHEYAKSLANPRNIKPAHNLSTIGRAVWLISIQFKNLCNPDKIAKELEQLHKDGKLYASDLRWINRNAVVRCDFFSKQDIDEAIHHTVLPHNKVAIAALAHLKTASTPPSSPIHCGGPNPPSPINIDAPNPPSPINIDAPNPPSPIVVPRFPQAIRKNSGIWRRESAKARKLPTPAQRRDNRTTQAMFLSPQKLEAAQILSHLNIFPPKMPDIEHVRTICLRLNDASKKNALAIFQKLPLMSQLYILEVIDDKHVEPFIKEMRESYITLSELGDDRKQYGNTPPEIRHRFFAYLEINKVDPVVSARYNRLIEALTPPA
jgi:hypothetical protein